MAAGETLQFGILEMESPTSFIISGYAESLLCPQLIAACESGADAVYFGLSDFSARARAANFTPEELPDVMAYLRERGVKGFVAMNFLVFDEELKDIEERAKAMPEAGVHAVIVQVWDPFAINVLSFE